MQTERADVVVVGAGAAGLMTAIWIGRTRSGPGHRIVLLDGAKKPGVKILVAGGGRCNVTHHQVDEKQYAGGSRNTIRNVLRRFDVGPTVEFFSELGVELKQEPTGKLFPVTDSAQTVLDALLNEVQRIGVELIHPWRVGSIEHQADGGFLIQNEANDAGFECDRLVLATGGKALPRSGSDGAGYGFARSLGHTITNDVFPSLVPLIVGDADRWIADLSGLSARVGVEVCAGSGKRLARFENDLLCTHFGLSGPAAMDASRWLTGARRTDPKATLRIAWLPAESFESVDAKLLSLGQRSPAAWLREHMPDRLAKAICEVVGVDPSSPGASLRKDARRALAHALVGMTVEATGDRGFTHAETTAGGVPLTEIDPKTMRSRACEGLSIVGEILDVDGRIGGFNFQWAWATGHIAGTAIGNSLTVQSETSI